MNVSNPLPYQILQLSTTAFCSYSRINLNYTVLKQLCHCQVLPSISPTTAVIAYNYSVSQTNALTSLNKSRISPLKDFQRIGQYISGYMDGVGEKRSCNRSLIEWLTLVLFNVSAIGERCISQIQRYVMQSTGIEDAGQFVKDKEGVELLRLELRDWIKKFLAMDPIERTLKAYRTNSIKQPPQLSILIQTIDYLCTKHNIPLPTNFPQPIPSLPPSPLTITTVNNFIFTQKISPLIQILSQNHNINQNNLVRILDGNYVNSGRKLFMDTIENGKNVVEGIVGYMVLEMGKGGIDMKEVFGQKYHEVSRLFRVFLKVLWNRHVGVALRFVEMFVMNNQSKGLRQQSNFQQIPTFFAQLVYQQSQFHSLMSHTFLSLSKKHGKSLALQLMKKLLLNRFLLSPQLHTKYHDWNEQELKDFAEKANSIRILFYEKKVEENGLSKTMGKLGIDVRVEFERFLNAKSKTNGSDGKIMGNGGLYIPDKILYLCYQRFMAEINWSNSDNSHSLSFSLLKNEDAYRNCSKDQSKVYQESRIGMVQESHSKVAIKEVKHLGKKEAIKKSYIPKDAYCQSRRQQPSKGSKYQQSVPNEEQQQSINKREHDSETQLTTNILTQDQKLQQLIEMRRQYGDQYRTLRNRFVERNNKWRNKSAWFRAINSQIKQVRKEVERSFINVKIDIDIL